MDTLLYRLMIVGITIAAFVLGFLTVVAFADVVVSHRLNRAVDNLNLQVTQDINNGEVDRSSDGQFGERHSQVAQDISRKEACPGICRSNLPDFQRAWEEAVNLHRATR